MSAITNLEFNRYNPANDDPEVIFDSDMLMRIEHLSTGLSRQEIMDFYGLELAELTPKEMKWLNKAYKSGLSRSKAKVTDKLVSAMSDKNGGVYALKYLELFADKFAETEASTNLNGGYTLQIVPTNASSPKTKPIKGNVPPKPAKSK